MTTDIITIPLNKLALWEGNVRKTGVAEQLDELTASIAAHGLIQPLAVRKGKKDRFDIVAGQRRYLALAALANKGDIGKNHPVPCHVLAPDADAAEISLAENVVRVAMHPADQFEAFSKLAQEGKGAADIAARFGVSESTVKKRLALGRVSPNLMTLYRQGEIGLEELSAFTLTDDHAEQERVWNDLPTWQRHPSAIRAALTQEHIPATDKRVRFVTLAAYEAAGGAVKRDLFSDAERGAFILDSGLLARLAQEKLETEAGKIRADGWKWVEARLEFGYEGREAFRVVDAESVPLTEEQQQEVERLAAEYDALAEAALTPDEEDEAEKRQQDIEARLDELENAALYTPQQRAESGIIITLDHGGNPHLYRGLIPKDADNEEAATREKPAKAPALPAVLIESLTTHKAAILAAELMANPDVALASVVYALVTDVFCMERGYFAADNSLKLSSSSPSLKLAEGSKAAKTLDATRKKLAKKLPATTAELWAWCLKQKREALLDVLAYCAAASVDAVQRRNDRPECDRLAHADALARALEVNVHDWFAPTAENYFGRVSKAFILAAYKEATGKNAPARWNTLKKPELASAAERDIGKTNWLPEPLRIGEPVNREAEEREEAA